MSAYEDLGGAAMLEERAPYPKPKTHRWKLIDKFDCVQKHYCIDCRTVRIRTTHQDRLPSLRFRSVSDQILEGKTPPCPWE